LFPGTLSASGETAFDMVEIDICVARIGLPNKTVEMGVSGGPCQNRAMLRRLTATLMLATLALSPVGTAAWGMAVHRLITGLAVDGLPLPLRQMFSTHRAFMVEHSVDPDEWRVVGLRGELGPEDPNHFLDIDALDEPAPFIGVPRDWNAYMARYGAERVEKAGRLPWRATEVYGRLVDAFKAMGSGVGYGAENARYLAAVLAHYVEDGHQPLHTAENYDGQLTGQRGLHSRFETELPVRYWSRLTHPAIRVQSVSDIKTFMFSAIVASNARVTAILETDKRAAQNLAKDANGRLVYDDSYYATMYRALRPMLEEALSESANAVASVIVAAWTEAGKPEPKR